MSAAPDSVTRPADDASRVMAAFREPPAPEAVLRAAGVSTAELRLEDSSRSHTVTFASLPDGSAYVVKRVSRAAHAAGRSLAAELYAYRLASWRPDLAAVVPRALHLDERRQVLVLAAAPHEHLYPAQALRPGFPSPALAAALGRALAALHSATADLPLVTVAGCGIVQLPDAPDEPGIAGGSASAHAVARAVVADAELTDALRRTAQSLVPSCLIHADVKWDNAVLDPGPPARVQLFDWELSGRGDPAWDVGSALADTVSLTTRLRGAGALPAQPRDWLSPALLAAYGRREDGFAERVYNCWTARTIHLALECAAAVDDAGHPVVKDLLATARLLAGASESVVTAIDAAQR